MHEKLVDMVRKMKSNAVILQYMERDFGVVWRQVSINSVLTSDTIISCSNIFVFSQPAQSRLVRSYLCKS